jgi:hypothetical protein
VTPHAVEWSVRIPVVPQPEESLAARGGFAAIAPAVLFDVLKITSTSGSSPTAAEKRTIKVS